MDSSIKISIITPSFNRGYIVGETAESILNQTSDNWEWVIVDDGSTDDSWEKLQSYAARDSRVKIFKRNRDPKGACCCRNIGVERCTGSHIMFLDTDDLLAPFCIEQRTKAAMQQPDKDLIIFPMLLFKKQYNDLNLLWNVDKEEDDLLRVLRGDPVCQGTGPLWKKSSFEGVGMWDEKLMLWQDIELHIRAFLYPVKYSKRLDLEPDVYLRISEDSLSRVGFHQESKLRSRYDVYYSTLNTMKDKGIADKYRDGLRVMGVDVITGLINGKLYKEAHKLVELAASLNVFSKSEVSLLHLYSRTFRLKMYRLPMLFNPISNKVRNLIDISDITLNQTEWTKSKSNN